MQELLTAKDLARILRMHRHTVYLMVRRGEIPHVRVGGAIRFRRQDVEKLLKPKK